MSEREPEDDERDDQEQGEAEESPPSPKAKAKGKPATGKAAARSSARAGAPMSATVATSRAITIGIVALAVGGAAGWFGQIQKAKAALRAEGAAAPAGSGTPSGPCGAWQSKICAGAGVQSAACQQAKLAAELLMPATCESALSTVPATLAKVKAARASCDKLVGKICQDLPPGSKTCDMVKERTPSFPPERCTQMLGSYDKVITELRQMDEGGGMPMGAPQTGGPGRMPPMGTPGGMRLPGGAPPMTPPPGAPHP